MSSVYNSLNLSYVGLPNSVCSAMRVRNALTENNALAANTALSHVLHLRIYISEYTKIMQ